MGLRLQDVSNTQARGLIFDERPGDAEPVPGGQRPLPAKKAEMSGGHFLHNPLPPQYHFKFTACPGNETSWE